MLPVHLAVHVPGCAVARDGGVGVSGRVGPLVEGIAERMATTTIVGYDPPTGGGTLEDRTDFLVRPGDGDLHFLSVGPKGTVRTYLSRRRRVRSIVERASGDWDLLLLPLVNRRVGLVRSANRCPRVVAHLGGHTPSVVLTTPMPPLRRLWSYVGAQIAERQYVRLASEALFFVNGEELLARHRRRAPGVELLRTSARRATHRLDVADRLLGPEAQLLFVGRVTPAKGVFEILDVLRRLRDGALPGAHLHVVGIGDALDELQRRAAAAGLDEAVTWHGWLPPGDELFRTFHRCDVMLSLSLAESLPKTVWEAMAHSVLVVATPIGALTDVFTDGVELLFVPPGDVDAAVEAVERLHRSPELRRSLLERGRVSAAHVTVEAVAAQLLARVLDRWPELADGR